MKHNKTAFPCFFPAALVLLLLSSFAAKTESAGVEKYFLNRPAVKNIIIMICDGSGFNHVKAADIYQYGCSGIRSFERFPVKYPMSTFAVDGHGYDPDLAWSDFMYVTERATDSAAAATAMSTSFKTSYGRIGVDSEGDLLEHLIEQAEEMEKATGVVSSVQLSHATPAGFTAHNVSRSNCRQIAYEMIEESRLDVIMGCGHPHYDDDGELDYHHNYEYVGTRTLWNMLVDGVAGSTVDADHNDLMDDEWTLVETRSDFRDLMLGYTPKRVIGIPQVYRTLQFHRAGDLDSHPFEDPLISTVPTLSEMTAAALNILDEDEDGFFLMVEGGAVDWASHLNATGRMIEEQIAFNDAVDLVVEWVDGHDLWDRTLVIVTSDHECGYITREREYAGEEVWTYESLQNYGAGNMPGMEWNSAYHTNSLVPLYAKGACAGLLQLCLRNEDPILGPYIDNATLPKLLSRIMD